MTQEKSTSNRLLKGTLILTAAGMVVKVIGSLNWIILSRVLGGEGIGLYQMAFPLYLLALSLSTAGIPVAISILTAEKIAKNDVLGRRQLFRASFCFLTATGLILSLAMYWGAAWLIDAGFIRDGRAYYSLLALSPAVFLVTLIAGLRGYLQGWQYMTPTAVSQIVEQLFRVMAMLFFASLLLPQGLAFAAGGASLGAAAGAAAGLAVLLYYYARLRRQEKTISAAATPTAQPTESLGRLFKRLFKLALPVSLASLMLPVVANLDLLIVPVRLEAAGYSITQATELFGYLTGMGVPLVNLATMMTAALATSIVPSVSAVASLGQKHEVQERITTAMRMTNLVIFPASGALYVLAVPVATVVYGAPQAGDVIQVLAFGVYLLGVHQVTTGVLQGLGRPTLPVVNMGLAAVVKIVLNYVLTAIPSLGICGAAWATNADFGVAALLNYYWISRHTGFRTDWAELGKTILATLLMSAAIYEAFVFLLPYNIPIAWLLLPLILLATVLYAAILLACGGLTLADAERVPFLGHRLASLLLRLRLKK